jgi:hypothetical protein
MPFSAWMLEPCRILGGCGRDNFGTLLRVVTMPSPWTEACRICPKEETAP